MVPTKVLLPDDLEYLPSNMGLFVFNHYNWFQEDEIRLGQRFCNAYLGPGETNPELFNKTDTHECINLILQWLAARGYDGTEFPPTRLEMESYHAARLHVVPDATQGNEKDD